MSDQSPRVAALAKLAEDLCALPPGARRQRAQNGLWRFDVHRYEDGWTVFRIYGDGVSYRHSIPITSRRDIGRFFADPLDFINFIMGDPSPRFALEAQDL